MTGIGKKQNLKLSKFGFLTESKTIPKRDKRKGEVKVMVNLVFYNCLVCGTMFLGEYGVEPVCPGPICVLRRQQELIRGIKEKIDILARQLQYHSEMRLICGCVLCGCPNCNILFLNENNNEPVCPICGDCDMD